VKHSAWAKAALAVSATMVIAACGSSHSSASTSTSSSSAAAGATGSAATTAKFTGCMVSDTGGVDDRSFNAAAWAGMNAAAAANPNISVKFSTSTSSSDYTPIINTFVSQKCNIIVTLGFAMGEATKAAAKANASQKFAIVDNTVPGSNVNSLVFNTVQDSFLGGYLAAGMTKTGKVATFGGQEFPTVTIYMDGYWDGVQYYNQKHGTHVQVLGWNEKTQKGSFTGDFTNQTKGQTLTQTFISEGADIIFPVAGNVGLGAAKAVQQADAAAGSQKVNMEWVDIDGCISAPTYCKYFITSVLKGETLAVKTSVLAAANGTFKGGHYIGTLANGGVSLAPFHDFDSQVPASLKSELQQISKGIQDGSIQTPTKGPVSL
jgi:basic membrane protein A and related proteins